MSDKPIAVGDLVQVVRPAICGCGTYLGKTFTVKRIRVAPVGGRYSCPCGANGPITAPYDVADDEIDFGFSLRILKRIPPLEELEGQRTEEKTKEPA